MNKLLNLATDPEQYSNGRAVTWIVDDVRQKKQQESFWNAVRPFIKDSCKSALDIGCGLGWSAEKFSVLGGKWVGLEPSSAHFDAAVKANPDLEIINTTFEKFETSKHFDCIIAIMVFSHLKDVGGSFMKIHGLLNDGGTFIMICSTFHDGASRLERNGRKYEVEVIDAGQYVDRAVVGAYGIADINRRSQYYIDKATANGLKLVTHSRVEDAGYSPKELLVFEK